MQHVLVIDDQAELCTAVQRILEANGEFRVSCALTGDEALPLLHRDRPDLIVLEPMLQGMAGIEFVAHATDRRIPVILTTGDATLEARLRRLGWPYLKKPLRLEKLASECRAVLADTQRNLRILRSSLERILKTTGEVQTLVAELQELRQRVAFTLASARRLELGNPPWPKPPTGLRRDAD